MSDKPKVTKRIIKKRSAEEIRRTRKPLDQQKRIGIVQEKDYHYHLFNDEGGRISAAKEAGYEFVEAPIRDGVTTSSDSSQEGKIAMQDVGNGVKAYYMRIPKEIWEEDQARKQKRLDQTDARLGLDRIPESVRRGKVEIDYGPLEK